MGDYSVGTQNPFNALEDEDTEPQAAGHEDDPARAQPKAHAKNATKTGQNELARRHPEKAAAVENTEAAQQKKHPKREFDRRSGTGRGREIPKGGRGGHNWGGADVPADNTEAVALDAAPKDEEAAGAPAAGAAPAGAAAEAEKVDLGYEDFVAQMQQKKPPEDLELKARAVIVDNKQFKAGKKLEASEEEPLFADLVNKKEKAKKEKAKTKNTISLDEFVAKNGGPLPRQEYRGDRDFDGGRGRGGRGRGRGGFRGGRGRGGFGGPAGPESADPAAAPAAAEAPAAGGEAAAPAAGAAPAGDQGFRGGRGGFRGGRGRGSFRGNDNGGGFRGRGGFRGGRGGRGGHPGGESRAAPVDVSDDSLFPALKKA